MLILQSEWRQRPVTDSLEEMNEIILLIRLPSICSRPLVNQQSAAALQDVSSTASLYEKCTYGKMAYGTLIFKLKICLIKIVLLYGFFPNPLFQRHRFSRQPTLMSGFRIAHLPQSFEISCVHQLKSMSMAKSVKNKKVPQNTN